MVFTVLVDAQLLFDAELLVQGPVTVVTVFVDAQVLVDADLLVRDSFEVDPLRDVVAPFTLRKAALQLVGLVFVAAKFPPRLASQTLLLRFDSAARLTPMGGHEGTGYTVCDETIGDLGP